MRAGVCLDPKDYRYSGYGEAVGSGRAQAWAGLARALGYEGGPAGVTGAEAGAEYRRRLFRTGVVASKAAQGVVEMEQARRVVEEEKGALPLEERLGCRLRFLTYGVVLGGQRFVEEHGARVCRAVAKAAGAAAGGWFVWRRGQAVPVTASD